MSEFEDNLWRDVVREHGDDLAQTPWPPPHRRRPRPGVLAGTTVVVAAAVAVLALVLVGTSTSPAYAVTTNHDGSITLTINRLNGIQGANVKLSSLGVRAMAVQVPAACRAALAVARFDPQRIPVGKTLVIAAWRAGHSVRLSSARIGRAGAPACLPPGRAWSAIKGQPPMAGVAARCNVSGPAALPPAALVPAGGTGTGTTESGTTGTATTKSGATGTETTQTTATGTRTSAQTGTASTGQTGTGTTAQTGTSTTGQTGTGTTPAAAVPQQTVSIPCGYRQVLAPAQVDKRVQALTQAARRKFAAACRAAHRPPSPQTATVPGIQSPAPPAVTIIRCRPKSSK